MNKVKKEKKFKLTEKEAKNAPTKDIEWEGEEVGVESTTKIQDDKGTGKEIILRFFTFAANKEAFKMHTPSAQELFDSHRKGIESLLWSDGLSPYFAVEPRIILSKDKSHYRFVVSCVPSIGNTLIDKTQTLNQLLNESR